MTPLRNLLYKVYSHIRFRLALHAALGSLIAGAIIQLVHLQYPLYAIIAAVVVVDQNAERTRKLAWQRTISTVIGALGGATTSALFDSSLIAMAGIIFLTVTFCYTVHLAEGAKVAGYIAGIVVLEHNVSPWIYATYRFLETLIGIGSAFLVSVLIPILLPERPGASAVPAKEELSHD